MDKRLAERTRKPGEFGYLVKWKVDEYRAEFIATMIMEEDTEHNNVTVDTTSVTGWVKWDGCMDMIYEQGYYLHFCDTDMLKQYTEMAEYVYKRGLELVNEIRLGDTLWNIRG